MHLKERKHCVLASFSLENFWVVPLNSAFPRRLVEARIIGYTNGVSLSRVTYECCVGEAQPNGGVCSPLANVYV